MNENLRICLLKLSTVTDRCRDAMLEMYPNKFLHFDDQRIYIMNTLFDLPRKRTATLSN